MDTLKKTYRDEAGIELAWKELIQVIKPSEIEPDGLKETKPDNRQAKHHPAFFTKHDFDKWEIFG